MDDYRQAVAPTQGGALLRVRVTPRAKATRLDGLHGDALRLRVTAPPTGGKANAAVVAVLASALRLRAHDLEIVGGERARSKTVRVSGLDEAAVAARLASALPSR